MFGASRSGEDRRNKVESVLAPRDVALVAEVRDVPLPPPHPPLCDWVGVCVSDTNTSRAQRSSKLEWGNRRSGTPPSRSRAIFGATSTSWLRVLTTTTYHDRRHGFNCSSLISLDSMHRRPYPRPRASLVVSTKPTAYRKPFAANWESVDASV